MKMIPTWKRTKRNGWSTPRRLCEIRTKNPTSPSDPDPGPDRLDHADHRDPDPGPSPDQDLVPNPDRGPLRDPNLDRDRALPQARDPEDPEADRPVPKEDRDPTRINMTCITNDVFMRVLKFVVKNRFATKWSNIEILRRIIYEFYLW